MNQAEAPVHDSADSRIDAAVEERVPAVSRRMLLRRAGVGVGSTAAAFWGGWGGVRGARATPPDVSADVDPGSLLSKLVRRITMGTSPAEMALANQFGYSGYLEYHLNYTAIDDSALQARLAPLTTLTMPYPQLILLPNGQVISELIEAVILRAVYSSRQLFERMVEFWTDHFNIDINKEADNYLKTIDDRDVIRQFALGTFPQLLDASAHSPAMLYYLDNTTSVAGNPNENYARELMELHTLGVDGGYTQTDVQEVARCFTGWTWFGRNGQPNAGTFRYNSSVHDNGQKIVLGHVIAAGGGMQDALTVLNILTNHPSCAAFIAKKLCRHLLADNVTQSVIDSVAAAYTQSGGDIKTMIRAALAPNVLHDAAPKYKRPFHHFMSAMRGLPTSIANTSGIRSLLLATGHMPFYWGSPDGYPDALDYWFGLILPRWNFGASLMNGTTGSISGVTVDSTAFFSGLTTADQMIDKINQSMFAGELTATERSRLRQYLLVNVASTTRRRETIGLAIGAPTFQWH